MIIVLAGVPIMVEVVVVVVMAAALENVLIVVVLITQLISVGSFMANQLGLIMLLLMGITPPLISEEQVLISKVEYDSVSLKVLIPINWLINPRIFM